jgi:hypothetical protein
MAAVFISHNSHDEATALRSALSAAGVTAYAYATAKPPGSAALAELSAELVAAQVVVVLAATAYSIAQRGLTRTHAELTYALDHAKPLIVVHMSTQAPPQLIKIATDCAVTNCSWPVRSSNQTSAPPPALVARVLAVLATTPRHPTLGNGLALAARPLTLQLQADAKAGVVKGAAWSVGAHVMVKNEASKVSAECTNYGGWSDAKQPYLGAGGKITAVEAMDSEADGYVVAVAIDFTASDKSLKGKFQWNPASLVTWAGPGTQTIAQQLAAAAAAAVAAAAKAAAERAAARLKIGEFVKRAPGVDEGCLASKADVGEIVQDDMDDQPYKVRNVKTGEMYWYRAAQLVRGPRRLVRALLEPNRLKVGEFVAPASGVSTGTLVAYGGFGIVIRDDLSAAPFHVRNLSHPSTDWYAADQLVRVAEADVPAAVLTVWRTRPSVGARVRLAPAGRRSASGGSGSGSEAGSGDDDSDDSDAMGGDSRASEESDDSDGDDGSDEEVDGCLGGGSGVGVVFEDDFGSLPFRVRNEVTGEDSWFRESQLELAHDAPISEGTVVVLAPEQMATGCLSEGRGLGMVEAVTATHVMVRNYDTEIATDYPRGHIVAAGATLVASLVAAAAPEGNDDEEEEAEEAEDDSHEDGTVAFTIGQRVRLADGYSQGCLTEGGHVGEIMEFDHSAVPYYVRNVETNTTWWYRASQIQVVEASVTLAVGAVVRVSSNEAQLRAQCNGHGGWVNEMTQYMGATGTVTQVFSTGDVTVNFARNNAALAADWCWNPASFTLVTEAPPAATASATSAASASASSGVRLTQGDRVRLAPQHTSGCLTGGRGVGVIETDDGSSVPYHVRNIDTGETWWYSARNVVRDGPSTADFVVGVTVRLTDDEARLRAESEGHGGFVTTMIPLLGCVGTVTDRNGTGDVRVSLRPRGGSGSEHSFWFNPASLTLAN